MRIRPLWLWRLSLLAFAVVYLASGSLQAWLPPLIPFLAAAVVEAQFFLQGARGQRGRRAAGDPGPQQRDLDELGWAGPAEARPARRRFPRRLLQAIAVLALLAGLFFLNSRPGRWQRLPAAARAGTVALLERQATAIAGHPATVICDVSGAHVGYVQDTDGLAEVGGRRAWLTPQICYRLYRVRHDRRAHGRESGKAIAVLAHEAWHLRGEANEGRANCFAYQSGVRVGEALGLTPTTARRLMREQLAANPSDFAETPAYVVPSGCHSGGSLDLRLDGSEFP